MLSSHGRTPHDGIEQFQAGMAMFFCMPCLCFVALGKQLSKLGATRKRMHSREVGGTREEESKELQE